VLDNKNVKVSKVSMVPALKELGISQTVTDVITALLSANTKH
jgi:hypothetical protein